MKALTLLLLLLGCAAPPPAPGPEPVMFLPGVHFNPAWGEWYRVKVAYDRAMYPAWPSALGTVGNPVFVQTMP